MQQRTLHQKILLPIHPLAKSLQLREEILQEMRQKNHPKKLESLQHKHKRTPQHQQRMSLLPSRTLNQLPPKRPKLLRQQKIALQLKNQISLRKLLPLPKIHLPHRLLHQVLQSKKR